MALAASDRQAGAGADTPEAGGGAGVATEGLSPAEATARLEQFGPNRLRRSASQPLWLKLAANFTHVMALLLWVGGGVAFAAQMPQLGFAIWAVNLINGVFSFWQEYQAERATQALQQLLAPTARVLRGGQEQCLPAELVVPGDLLLLAEGDRVAADAHLTESANLRVDQSLLTGEADPVHKSATVLLEDGERRSEAINLVFAGTSVASGTARGVVTATGMATRLGHIAHITQTVGDEASPLQRELARLTRTVTVLACSVGLFFFALAVAVAGVDLTSGFVFAMGMIVAFVPEGMLPTVTLALAMGVQRLARRHALVKRLSAVETLGSTTVICTDKTGTLTQNEMTVGALWLPHRRIAVTGAGYAPAGTLVEDGAPLATPVAGDLRRLLRAGALCNNARFQPPADPEAPWTVLGDTTEAALLVAAGKGGVDVAAELRAAPRRRELPFDSHRKRMSTLHQTAAGLEACVKGAPRELLALCRDVRVGEQTRPLDAALRAAVANANDEFSRQGLRVLAVAERSLPAGVAVARRTERAISEVEAELTFLGLVAIHDPPRPEVAEAITRCHRAGIRMVMITGDYGLTAESIARRIGMLVGPTPRVITGAELDALDDGALREALRGEVLCARVDPEHKLRVVSALQAMGEVVAVTGDGVNDAPALKKADIGVAMGRVGTDVAREAADMILTDDNFATIVNAIEAGRSVYQNIRKFAVYVFNSNMAEAVPFIAMLFSRGAIPLPLTVMQVLAVDLGTDMVPAIGLGAEAAEPGVMDQPPRSRREPLLTRGLLARALLWYGLIESAAAMSAYFFVNWRQGWPAVPLAGEGSALYVVATTVTLAGVVATQVGAVFGCRTNRSSVFSLGLFSNRLVLLGVAIELLLLVALVYLPPLQAVFHTAPLGPVEWAFVFAWTPVIFVADEVRKALLRRRAARGPASR